MKMKNFKLLFVFTLSLLLSACGAGVRTSNTSLPTNPKKTSTPATIEQMYPHERSDVSKTYPAWEVPTIRPQNLQPPSEANTPVSGKASISGLLFAFDISVPLSNVDFVLMPALITDGKALIPPILTYGNSESGDIFGKTDEKGVFFLDDILPGLYFLLVNYPDHSEIAVNPEITSEPLLLEFNADTAYPLGVVLINS